jgi:hypothetical protein
MNSFRPIGFTDPKLGPTDPGHCWMHGVFVGLGSTLCGLPAWAQALSLPRYSVPRQVEDW